MGRSSAMQPREWRQKKRDRSRCLELRLVKWPAIRREQGSNKKAGMNAGIRQKCKVRLSIYYNALLGKYQRYPNTVLASM